MDKTPIKENQFQITEKGKINIYKGT